MSVARAADESAFAATLRLLDFDHDEVDVAIRFGKGGDDSGLFVRPVIREWVTPMMQPLLARQFTTPASLRRATLMYQDGLATITPEVTWPAGFDVAGLGRPQPGARFRQADHALDAACAGAGVILGRVSLADRALREGLPVAPLDLALTIRARTRFLCPRGAAGRPQVAAFPDWLLVETNTLDDHATGRRFVAYEGLSD